MRSNTLNKIEEWRKLNKSVSNLYIKIIEHEQMGSFGTEYKSLKSLLPDAINYEKKAFERIGVNKSNHGLIERELKLTDQEIISISNGDYDKLNVLRGINLYDQARLFEHLILEDEPIYSISDFVSSKNKQIKFQNEVFECNYHNQIIINFIQMINKYISETDDKRAKDYLIYLKYMTIATSPTYENAFLEFNLNCLPTIDVVKTFPYTEGYEPNKIEILTRKSLERDILNEIKTLLHIDNFTHCLYTETIYRVLALNKARLISLKDKSFIDKIAKEINDSLDHRDLFSTINKEVGDMFFDAYEIIKKDYYALKKVGK